MTLRFWKGYKQKTRKHFWRKAQNWYLTFFSPRPLYMALFIGSHTNFISFITQKRKLKPHNYDMFRGVSINFSTIRDLYIMYCKLLCRWFFDWSFYKIWLIEKEFDCISYQWCLFYHCGKIELTAFTWYIGANIIVFGSKHLGVDSCTQRQSNLLPP